MVDELSQPGAAADLDDAAAKPKHERHEHDAYDTDPACALACVRWCAENLGLREGPDTPLDRTPLNILDPMAGTGPFVRAARTVWPESRVAAVDIRPEVEQAMRDAGASWVGVKDIFQIPHAAFEKVDLVVTNPSFTLAEQLVRHIWPGLKDGASIAVLLNCTFIAGQDRWGDEGLYQLAPLRFMAPIVPRPSFLVIDGKESSGKFEAALFVWTKGWAFAHNPDGDYNALPTTIPSPIRWEKPKKPRKPRKKKSEG